MRSWDCFLRAWWGEPGKNVQICVVERALGRHEQSRRREPGRRGRALGKEGATSHMAATGPGLEQRCGG